ncbi:MAG: hypothetical protein ACJ748_15655 [Flavisolibacter sp.]
MQTDVSAKAGTAGGTLLVILLQIRVDELFKTAILALVGAIVSFTVSMALKWIVKRKKKIDRLKD